MMRQKVSWIHWLVAVVVVLAGGLGLAFAGSGDSEDSVAMTYRIEVRQDADEEVEVTVGDALEVLSLDDLADGESRTFGEGEHQVVVRRDGDELLVEVDGRSVGELGGRGSARDTMVWVTSDEDEYIDEDGQKVKKIFIKGIGEGCEWSHGKAHVHRIATRIHEGEDGEHKVFVVKAGEDDEKVIELRGLDGAVLDERLVRIKTSGLLKDADGAHKVVVAAGHGGHDRVVYRCEDSDEVLVIAEDLAIAETYYSPVSGCEMKRLDEAHARVVTVVKEIHEEKVED